MDLSFKQLRVCLHNKYTLKMEKIFLCVFAKAVLHTDNNVVAYPLLDP